MKKSIVFLFVLSIGLSAIYALDFRELDKYSYIGVSLTSYSASGFEDAEIYDVPAELSEANVSNKKAYGLTLGLASDLVDRIRIYGEINIDFPGFKSYLFDGGVGAAFYILDDFFHLGVGAKAEYFYLANVVGVFISSGRGKDRYGKSFTIYSGDLLTYRVMGVSVKPFVTVAADLNSPFAVGLTLGYKFGISFYDYISINGYNMGHLKNQYPVVDPTGIYASFYGIYKY